MNTLIAFLIAVFSSIIGGICGIGGGILMKPVLDMIGFASVASISFLSGMTVLAMSGYRTIQSFRTNSDPVNVVSLLPLALGAASGGIFGKLTFEIIKSSMSSPNTVGAVQSICLAAVSVATALFTVYKSKIKTKNLTSPIISSVIGFVLGTLSSFLGIGGGPINIPVLVYFFSMDSKKAAQSSLFIIVISQFFSLIYTLISNTLPDFEIMSLASMSAGGIIGGIVSKKISAYISNEKIDKLFVCLMAVIVFICIINFGKYAFRT